MSTYFKRQDYIDYIKLMLTGNLLELEVPDESIGKFVDQALMEIQRYIDETKLITVPFSRCIDLKEFEHSSIVNIYRTSSMTGDTNIGMTTSDVDPMFAQQWSIFGSGGANMYNLQSYLYQHMAYATLMQIRNTLSTPLDFKEDKHGNKLYISATGENIQSITIEYIPIFHSVDEITSDYWIDILKRMSLGLVKIALGRIRTRFTQSNALWQQDGERLLQEGLDEVKELRETLRTNSVYFYPLD